MIISHKHKFIFLKTRKTAGTSLDIGLSAHCGPKDIITTLTPEDERLRQELGYRGPQNFRWLLLSYRPRHFGDYFRGKRPIFRQHLTAADTLALVGEEIWNEYFKFTIEREPYDKAISRYWWGTHNLKVQPTMEEFFDSALLNRLTNRDIYTIRDKPVVDMIIRFENLKEDLQKLQEKLGLGEIVMPRAKGKHRKDRRHYSQVLSPTARRRIELVCAKEIQHFGYEWTEAEAADETLQSEILKIPRAA